MKKPEKNRDPKNSKLVRQVKGVVQARKCRHCGHHEIGVITETGNYLLLIGA